MTAPAGDTVGAFIAGPELMMTGAGAGPLAGLTFAVKDLFDVEGRRTGGGNPDWLAQAEPATATAAAVLLMLDAGATLVGKTHTDELAYSIAGTNVHYGTPVNVNAPDRIPGGSSSGSAAAVAAGIVDVALGTDTGGSIRVPASYCGIFGLRPSWGRVPENGLLPLSYSYDTVGPFARDPALLAEVAAVLFGGGVARTPPERTDTLVIAEDAWALAEPATSVALRAVVERSGLAVETVDLAGASGGLDTWLRAFRAIQGSEGWAVHGGWISSRRPSLGPGVAERFAAGSRVTAEDLDAAAPVRRVATERLRAVLDGGHRVLVLPSTSGPAPLVAEASARRADIRERTLRLTCIAGHAGAPVVSAPLTQVDGLPVGLSLVGLPWHDEQVLALAATLWAQVEV